MKLFQALLERFRGRPVDWDELEEALLRADLGVRLTQAILDDLRAKGEVADARAAAEAARACILAAFPPPPPPLRPHPSKPKAILMAGVNGTGKTTSCAKLAARLLRNRHTCLLVAADTFRAAAMEQLEAWGARLGVEVLKGAYGGDAAALCHDALAHATRRNIEFVICDTAGRLHTKDNLMRELGKVVRALGKVDPEAPHEKFLVVDATTGSNALAQAREFHQAIGLTGVVLTKLDGSGKGGVAAAIAAELGVPTRFLGTGEKAEDFAEFEPHGFAEQLL